MFHNILGLSSGYQATGSSGVQVDLPQLTGEDLRMLDTFEQIRPGSLQPQPQQPSTTTLNYHGNGVLM